MSVNIDFTPIFTKAWRSPEFKRALLENPKSILQEELGIAISEEVQVNVVEETEFLHYILLSMCAENSSLMPLQEDDSLAPLKIKAISDRAFLDELIAHPKTVIQEEMGWYIPEEAAVEVLVETANTKYLILPPKPTIEDVIERAWGDEVFKQNLLNDPQTELGKLGFQIPEGNELKVFEETDFQRYIVLPHVEDSNALVEPQEDNPLSILQAKAVREPVFKQELIENPKATIEQELGFSIPTWVDFQVLEATSETSYLVIPTIPSEEELSEEEMMAVAGGWRVRLRRIGRRIGRTFRRGWRIGGGATIRPGWRRGPYIGVTIPF